MSFEVVPATLEHAAELAANARYEDQQAAMGMGTDVIGALNSHLPRSRGAQAGILDGRVLCIRGVFQASLLQGWGWPWMIGAADAPSRPHLLMRRARPWVQEALETYTFLRTSVDARYDKAVRLLEWLRFQRIETILRGSDKLPFHTYELRN